MTPISLIKLSERLYRVLLLLYPAAYRREYGLPMRQVFRDVSLETWHRQGWAGLVRWWGAAAVDLLTTGIGQWSEIMTATSKRVSSKAATAITLLLCLPAFTANLTSQLGLKLPFEQLLTVGGGRPSTLGRIVMLLILFGLPAAFLINLLSMVKRAGSEPSPSFRPTPVYIIIGMSMLLIVLILWAGLVTHELRPLLAQQGSGAGLGQIIFLLGLLVLPAVFLINRLPPVLRAGSRGALVLRPTPVNLMIGAIILLVILMVASGFVLEALACASGVPNCD